MVRSVLEVNALIFSVFDGQETRESGQIAELEKRVLFYLRECVAGLARDARA